MANEQLKANEPRPVTVLKTDRQLSTIRFSSCGHFLAGAGRDAVIRLWSVPEPPAPAEDVLDALENKAPKPANKKLPEPVFPELTPLKGHDGWVTSLAFHPKQTQLFSADSWGRLIGWSVAATESKTNWNLPTAHDGWIRQIAIGADGERLATCGSDKKVCLWSTADGKKVLELGHDEEVYAVAFHPDRKSLVSGDLKGVVKHWDLESGKPLRELDAKVLYLRSQIQDVGGVRTLTFDRDGATLAAAGAEPSGGGFVQGVPILRLFNWKTGAEKQTLKLGDNTDVYIHEVLFHPAGYWIGAVSGQPGKGKFFLLRSGEAAPFFSAGKLANCHSIAVHPNAVMLAVISNAGTFGQAKSKAREGDYAGNFSPVNIWELPAAAGTQIAP